MWRRVRDTEKGMQVTAGPELPELRVSVSERAKQVIWLWHQQSKLYRICIWVSCYYSWNTKFTSGIPQIDNVETDRIKHIH